MCREAGVEEEERHRLSLLLGNCESTRAMSLVAAKRVIDGLIWLLGEER